MIGPALCNIAGIVLLFGSIGIFVLSFLPKYYGLEAYNMSSGNMVPTIPVGSIVYVLPIEQKDLPVLLPDDIIAWNNPEEGVAFGRVSENHIEDEEFILTEDYSEEAGETTVEYKYVIGLVEKHRRALGDLMEISKTSFGKLNLFVFAVCGLLLNALAWKLRNSGDDE